MTNIYSLFKDLLPKNPQVIATINSSAGGKVECTMVGGGRIQALGSGVVGTKVFIQGGVVQGVAPNLTVELIDI